MKENKPSSPSQVPPLPPLPPGIYVSGTVVAATPEAKTGKTKKDGSGYTMATTQCLIADRFALLVEYHPSENAACRKFAPGPFAVRARAVGSDPKNPQIVRISLAEDEA